MLLGWLFVDWHVYHEIGSSAPMCGSKSRVMVEDLSTQRGFFCRIDNAAMSWFVRQQQVDVRRTSVTSLDL